MIIKNMNELKEIKVPLLNDSGYGANINEVIQNINENFKILSNRDFVKGDKGNSLITRTINLSTNDEILNGLKQAVSNQYFNNPIKPKDINGVNIFDWFKNPGNITLMYELVDGEEVIISATPYVFKDLRFEQLYKSINTQDYDKETDYSCVIYYNNGEFVAIQEFPTLYYDSDNNCFSWKINGVVTGLEAMGPRGFAGKDGVFKIVKVIDEAVGVDEYKISHVLHGGNFINVNGSTIDARDEHGNIIYDSNNNPIKLSGQVEICKYYGVTPGISVMVLKEDNTTYMSSVYKTEGESQIDEQLIVYCGEDNLICEIEPMSGQEVRSICDEYYNEYLKNK